MQALGAVLSEAKEVRPLPFSFDLVSWWKTRYWVWVFLSFPKFTAVDFVGRIWTGNEVKLIAGLSIQWIEELVSFELVQPAPSNSFWLLS